MSSVEIEDVLSSIRRLVTEDLRPKPVLVEDKLILTPALRVVAEVPPEVAEDTAAELEVDLDGDLAVALTEAGVEPGLEDTAENDGPFPMFLHHASRVDRAKPAVETAQDIAETVSAIGAAIPAEGYESETGDVMPVPEWPDSSWVAPEVIDVVEEAELIDGPEAAAPWAEDDGGADWTEAEVAEAAPEMAEAVLETADAAAAEAAALAALAAEEFGEAAEAPLTELDEDMLREIVREIIREELQGTLGERITRNVRKLVRAEINRALLTQDME